MRFDAVRSNVLLESRSRVLAGHSRSAQPARRPSRGRVPRSFKEELFRKEVWSYWKKNGRHDLPWRKTSDPYRILVSEMMLQQTQVLRVKEKYEEFLRVFPNVRTLAKVSLAGVLKMWSGLGYNRRAKFLRDAASEIVEKHGGKVPREYAELRALPGIGDYTARAVRVFAFNEPDVLIETNIRAALISHFFSHAGTIIYDSELLPIAQKAMGDQNPRQWHSALMDYGSYIKKLRQNPTRKSAHYTKQSKFEGSFRQLRGQVLRALMKGEKGRKGRKWEDALASLARDGLIVRKDQRYRIA